MPLISLCNFSYEIDIISLNHLITQLNPDMPPIIPEQIEDMLSCNSIYFFKASDNENKLIGTITLAIFPIPTGTRCWIEDVVVDEKYRGRGLGESLVSHAIEFAKIKGVSQIDLTSRPSREAANKLYQKLGFEKRETNVYRLKI